VVKSHDIAKPELCAVERSLCITADGSHSIMDSRVGEQYHSQGGAVSESLYTFIHQGFTYLTKSMGAPQAKVFELGFGTGLNALLTWIEADDTGIPTEYMGIEAYPITSELWSGLNYGEFLPRAAAPYKIGALHEASWDERHVLSSLFSMHKVASRMEDYPLPGPFNLVYFDAFSPGNQAELWSPQIFGKLYAAMESPGILVTYSAAAAARRSMLQAGFWIEELPGALGKKEMTRAIKW
jgi:tRNA U34 5-methylaminomethyl-2-thiouridine-forming methyltransferase MnmC